MSQTRSRGEKICSGQEISEGRTDRWKIRWTDRLITIARLKSGALIIIPLNIFYVKLHENHVIQFNSEIVSMISAHGEKSMKLFTGGI